MLQTHRNHLSPKTTDDKQKIFATSVTNTLMLGLHTTAELESCVNIKEAAAQRVCLALAGGRWNKALFLRRHGGLFDVYARRVLRRFCVFLAFQ